MSIGAPRSPSVSWTGYGAPATPEFHDPPEGTTMTGKRADHGPGPDDVPLPMKIPRVKSSGETSRKAQVAFAYAWCPTHKGEKRTGLLLESSHLRWKVHYIILGSGTAVPCRTSGALLCSASLAMPADKQMTLNLTPQKRDADPMHGVRKARCLHN